MTVVYVTHDQAEALTHVRPHRRVRRRARAAARAAGPRSTSGRPTPSSPASSARTTGIAGTLVAVERRPTARCELTSGRHQSWRAPDRSSVVAGEGGRLAAAGAPAARRRMPPASRQHGRCGCSTASITATMSASFCRPGARRHAPIAPRRSPGCGGRGCREGSVRIGFEPAERRSRCPRLPATIPQDERLHQDETRAAKIGRNGGGRHVPSLEVRRDRRSRRDRARPRRGRLRAGQAAVVVVLGRRLSGRAEEGLFRPAEGRRHAVLDEILGRRHRRAARQGRERQFRLGRRAGRVRGARARLRGGPVPEARLLEARRQGRLSCRRP